MPANPNVWSDRLLSTSVRCGDCNALLKTERELMTHSHTPKEGKQYSCGQCKQPLGTGHHLPTCIYWGQVVPSECPDCIPDAIAAVEARDGGPKLWATNRHGHRAQVIRGNKPPCEPCEGTGLADFADLKPTGVARECPKCHGWGYDLGPV